MNKKATYIAAAVCLVCVVGMIVALAAGRRTEVRFTPPEFDSAAIAGVPSDPPASYGKINAQAYTVSVCGAPELSGNELYLYLTNHEENSVYLKVRLLGGDGTLLGESGVVRPGEYLPAVTLTAPLPEDGMVTVKLMAYDMDTWQSAGAASLQITVAK